MAFSVEARTAAVTAALAELRGTDPRIPRANDQRPAIERAARLNDMEARLLKLAWETINSGKHPAPTEVMYADSVAIAQHWIDTDLCPALAVPPGDRLCDAPLMRALRAAVVVLDVTKPDEAYDRRSRLVGTASTTAYEHGRIAAPVGGEDR